MNVSSRIALTLIAAVVAGGIVATEPARASGLQVVPGVPAVPVIPKPARYTGTHGLRVGLWDGADGDALPDAAYVQDNSPLNEGEYHARFYVNINGIKMVDNNNLDIFQAIDADGADTGGAQVLRVELRQVAGVKQLNVCAFNSASGDSETCLTDSADEQVLARSWHNVEVKYLSGTPGSVSVWLNGKAVVIAGGSENLGTITNGASKIDYVRLGAVAGMDVEMDDADDTVNNTSDSLLRFDDFVSQRANYIGVQPVFADVPPGTPFWGGIYGIYAGEVTGGCGGGNYCPTSGTLRKEMAVFLMRGINGGLYTPPTCTGSLPAFADVACPGFDASYLNAIYALRDAGITTGCGGGNYCPEASVTRDQMAIFLLRSKHKNDVVPYTVPSCTLSPTHPANDFTDVPCPPSGATAPYANWIYALRDEGITTGCGTNVYCPTTVVTRDTMGLFMARAFSLPILQVGP